MPLKPETIQAAIMLSSALTYKEGEVAFTEGTPEYAIMDAINQHDEISNEIDRRLGNPPGTTKTMWNYDWSKVPGVASDEEE